MDLAVVLVAKQREQAFDSFAVFGDFSDGFGFLFFLFRYQEFYNLSFLVSDITLEWPPPRALKTLLATLQLLTVSVRTFRYLFCHLL